MKTRDIYINGLYLIREKKHLMSNTPEMVWLGKCVSNDLLFRPVISLSDYFDDTLTYPRKSEIYEIDPFQKEIIDRLFRYN